MTDASFQFFGKVAQRATMLAGAIIIVLAIIIPEFANAQNAKPLRIVRDSETEHIIRTMATPLFSAAGLDPESVKIILVEDNTLNAFVSGGMNIFIHTGLITQSESPEALIGVLAHETGHIQGGHLVRGRDAMEQARTIGTITAILGTAAAIGSGRGDVAGAAIMGGQSIATRSFLKFSRTQESAADHAAFRLLDATNTTATGLEKFLEKLKDQDLMPARFQDPYMLTHPLNTQRIAAIKEHIKNSPNSNANVPDKTRDDFDMIVAKLFGFLNPFDQVLRRYPESDGSIPARYARAIAHYRKANIDNTVTLMNGLIEDMPSNPYFYEMRAQALFENARALDALPDYKKAYELSPNDALLALGLANVELELGDPELLKDAIKHFRASLTIEPESAFAWRQLGIAYGRAGNMAMSSLALAEEALRKNNLVDAEHLATRAADGLKKGSADYIRALDVIEATKIAQAQKNG